MKRNERTFKGIVAAIAAALTAVFMISALVPAAIFIKNTESRGRTGEREYDSKRDGEVIRLHVIANGDGERDQRIKLAVRDALLRYEREYLAKHPAKDAAEAEEQLLSNGGALLETVNAVLDEESAGYSAQLVLGDFDFPDREYGGTLYKAGSYRALRVVLGSGSGRNWWCIMFPPLCVIEPIGNKNAESTAAPYGEKIEFKSLFVRLWELITGGRE